MRTLSSEYPIKTVCEVLGWPGSTYYYQSREPSCDGDLREAIASVVPEWAAYGYRRVTSQLRRQGWVVNHKRVSRQMRQMGLQAKIIRVKKKTTDSEHPFPRYPNLVRELSIDCPDQVRVSDITYIRLGQEFIYLAVIMDVFTRCIRGWQLGRSSDQSLTIGALKRAPVLHCPPQIHHSDQGVQYAASAYVGLFQASEVQISMAEVGAAWQNGYAERLMLSIKEEEVDLSDYDSYTEANCQIGRFLDDVYMHKRIHSALGYLTPAEFESQWLETRPQDPETN